MVVFHGKKQKVRSSSSNLRNLSSMLKKIPKEKKTKYIRTKARDNFSHCHGKQPCTIIWVSTPINNIKGTYIPVAPKPKGFPSVVGNTARTSERLCLHDSPPGLYTGQRVVVVALKSRSPSSHKCAEAVVISEKK